MEYWARTELNIVMIIIRHLFMFPTKAWIYYRKVYIHTCRKRERKKPNAKHRKRL